MWRDFYRRAVRKVMGQHTVPTRTVDEKGRRHPPTEWDPRQPWRGAVDGHLLQNLLAFKTGSMSHVRHQRLNTVLGVSSKKAVRMVQLSSCQGWYRREDQGWSCGRHGVLARPGA